MPIGINTKWQVVWPRPWSGSVALDGLTQNDGSVTFRGDMGVMARVDSFVPPGGAMQPAQTWQTGFGAGSVSVTITRAGGSGSLLSFSVLDSSNTEIGAIAGVDYPAGLSTVVIPLSVSSFDLQSLTMTNDSYPSGIDATVTDITAATAVAPSFWTDFVACEETP